MTTIEAEWDDLTRTQALALEKYRDGLCHNCGLPIAVCQSGENEFAFEADGPYRCHAATAVIRSRSRLGDEVEAREALTYIPRLRTGR